jgi:hypothetical protein
MSINVFLAVCVLGTDFLIYFLFQLVYGEKRRTRRRRLPSDFYRRSEKSFPLYTVPAGKGQVRAAARVIKTPGFAPCEHRRCRCATISVNDSSDNLGQAQ